MNQYSNWAGPGAFQPKTWQRSPGLKAILPPNLNPHGASPGRVWTHGIPAARFMAVSTLTMPRDTMGAVEDTLFDGCTNKTDMLEFVAATKWDALWKGVGVGFVLGIAATATASYLLKR